MPLEVGQVFAGYTIVRVLGAGGMGKVYLASHPRLPRQDAVKVVPADLTADPEFRARFLREAELAASLSHPHIVAIHDRGEDDGHFWISMDYVAGTDVSRLMRDKYPEGMPVDEALPIITAVAFALDFAHQRGLLHRDVKPANILLTDPDGGQEQRVFLADFGIARRIDDAAGLTATNMTVGTAAYAAPEQLKGQSIDGRADQYALACTAFHLLTGKPPYVHSNPAVVITQHVIGPPAMISARRPELAGLDWVFATALAKEPAGRFGSCAEFAGQLRQSVRPGSTSGGHPAFPQTRPLGVTAPTLPPVTPPSEDQRPARRGRVLIGALLGIALLIAGGVFAVAKLTGHQSSTPAAGPLTGTYRADFGPPLTLDSMAGPGPTTPPVTSSYGLRSVCRSTGCVATAARVAGAPLAAEAMVFDQVGERWVAVTLGSDQCHGKTSEFWQVLALQPRPDGSLAGVYTATSSRICATTRTVTFTRTADVDSKSVPDPGGQPPRVPSPAQGLYGHYHSTWTFANGLPERQGDYAVATECLRTGDRCMSYFHQSSHDEPLAFSGGKWTWNVEGDGQCASGAPTRPKDFAEFPLPQPAQNPITRISGHGHHEQTPPCAISTDFDQTFTRTAD